MAGRPSKFTCTIQLVKHGYLLEVLEALTPYRAKLVEPLSVTVQKFSGAKPVVAKEIEEVTDDILKRIIAATESQPNVSRGRGRMLSCLFEPFLRTELACTSNMSV
jgi:hypothetical protein